MNDGEAIMAAKASLAARLISWRLPEAHVKANEFIDDMVRNGWKPHPKGLRRPPTASEECPKHVGEWQDFCRACVADRKAADQDAALPDGRWTPERIRADVREACAKTAPESIRAAIAEGPRTWPPRASSTTQPEGEPA